MSSLLHGHDLKNRLYPAVRRVIGVAVSAGLGLAAYVAHATYAARQDRDQIAVAAPAAASGTEPASAGSPVATIERVQAPERPPRLLFDATSRDPFPPPRMGKDERACLARAVHGLARDDGVAEQIGLAQLILNRVRAGATVTTICETVRMGHDLRDACAKPPCRMSEAAGALDANPAMHQARWIADDVAAGRAWLSELDTATHVHAATIAPPWRHSMIEVARVGRLIFYRNPDGPIVPPLWTDSGAAQIASLNGAEPLADQLPNAATTVERLAPQASTPVQSIPADAGQHLTTGALEAGRVELEPANVSPKRVPAPPQRPRPASANAENRSASELAFDRALNGSR